VRPGERRAVLALTVPGKTTLLTALPAIFHRLRTIRFFGEDVTNFPPFQRIRRGLRRTYQISALFPAQRSRQRLPCLLWRFAQPLFRQSGAHQRRADAIGRRSRPGGAI